MEYRKLEVTLTSAKDLNKVNLISKMDVYAVVTIEGGGNKGNQKTKTPVSNDGDTNPSWNYSMNFTVDENLARQNRLTLVFRLRCERALGDKDIGEVHVPVKELLETAGGAAEGKPQFVSYQVRKPSGKAKGQLNFSYKLGEKVSGPVSLKEHEPVTAYPAAAPVGTSSPYPPPNSYPPPPAAASPYPAPKVGESSGYTPPPVAYPHAAPAPAAAAGYPPPPPPPAGYGYGYPPPPHYGGYPPAGAYGYPPQPGYGYQPVQQPPKKNKNKMGLGLGAGLLGGALGGLLIGEAISDVSSYDAGYDAGFGDGGDFDGGFDF